MKLLGIWLLFVPLCGGCVAVSQAPVRSTNSEEQPFPYGKAEYEAERVKDVMDLIRRGDRYRADCVGRFENQAPLSIVEHFGREAKAWYRVVLEREPSNAYAFLCIGYIDLILGRSAIDRTARDNFFSSAMSRFREAQENRPGYADARLYMAEVQALRGEYTEAEKNLQLILNSSIENSDIHSWMAYILIQTKQKAEAQKHIVRAIELDNPSMAAQWSRRNQQAG
ncbi:MAG: hypothetical protein ABII12_05215 [Planctomycetota bacterium]